MNRPPRARMGYSLVRLALAKRSVNQGRAIDLNRPSGSGHLLCCLPRAIAFGLQIPAICPVANADAGLQAILVCGTEVNASVQPAHCSFLCCSETGWKAAVHAGQEI